MKQTFKKLVRSTQVFFPGVVEAKFTIRDWIHRSTGGIFKSELNGLRHFDLDRKLLLDIGANRGQCIIAFRMSSPTCRIIAFEPNRHLSDRLAARYADDPSVHIEPCALSSRPGTLTLYIPSYRNYLFDGLASVDPSTLEWFNSDRLYWFDPSKISVEIASVPSRTLDSYNLDVALMKVHAQGSEILILEGAEKTMTTHHPIIITAWTWGEEADFLRAHGYRPYAYRCGHFYANRLGHEFTWFLLPEHADQLGRSVAVT